MSTPRTTLAIGLGLFIATSASAAAQTTRAKEDGFVRSGMVFSVTGGWGTFAAPACESCTGRYYAGSFGVHVGSTVGDRAVLMGGVDVLEQDGRSLASLNLLFRWFFEEQLFGDVGIGTANLSFTETGQLGSAQFQGTSAQIAVGVDLVQGRSFALEASLRAIGAYSKAEDDDSIRRLDGALTFQFGATWY